MGKRKVLLPAAMLLSALSALAGMLPYILIWLIVRELLEHGEITSSGNVVTYAWWAAGMAVASIVLYFAALMSSHLAAFRVESNLRKEAMRQIVRMPLGFFDINTSGRIRKIIDDNAGVTHSFLAHQLPDLAATFLVPLVAVILIFMFDWILGLACIVPVIIAMLVMGFMMNAEGRQFMKSYMTSLEEMNTEAVEYVRGIPVVKVFQQTIYSFKNFHRCIMNYNKMVFGYTRMWEKPMSLYTVIINGFVFFLAPLAILLIGYSGNYASVLLNFFLFVLITPVFSQSIMKSMYLNQALGQASEAIGRLENLVAYEHLTVVAHPQPVKEFSIQFEKVSFSYPGANQKAVDDVSFTIPQGNTVALVGASGGGKTTIARLVPRFWEATEGKVLIGGINVREIAPEELMKHISEVALQVKDTFIGDIDRDSEAYDSVFACFKMPKATDEEKAARSAAIQEATKFAALVPMQVARNAFELMTVIMDVARLGNRNAVTDACVAMMSARSAVLGALMNVRINLGSLKDKELVAKLQAEADELERLACAKEKELLDEINEELKV